MQEDGFSSNSNTIPSDRLEFELNAGVLAKIDILIDEEIYGSRVEFIDRAIKKQLSLHEASYKRHEKSKSTVLGVLSLSSKTLEKKVATGKKMEIKVIGALTLDEDITPELADQAIARISLAGILRAPDDVIPVLNQRRYSLLGRPYSEIIDGSERKKLTE